MAGLSLFSPTNWASDSIYDGFNALYSPTSAASDSIYSAFDALSPSDSSGWGLGNMFGANGWLGGNLMDVLGTVGSIGSGLASYFNGQNMMDLARDQFNFNKALANRNMQNQAKIINNQYDSSAEVAAAMAGNRGTTTDEKIQQYRNNAAQKHVNSDWIG